MDGGVQEQGQRLGNEKVCLLLFGVAIGLMLCLEQQSPCKSWPLLSEWLVLPLVNLTFLRTSGNHSCVLVVKLNLISEDELSKEKEEELDEHIFI